MGASFGRRVLLAGLALVTMDRSRFALAAPVATAWQPAMISSGDNRPAIDLEADRLHDILAALHRQTPLAQIADDLRLTQIQLLGRINRLTDERVAQRGGSGFTPAILVVGQVDAAAFLGVSSGIVAATAAAITRALPGIRDRYTALPGFTHVDFSAASLLILSNCLLDNWQIDTIEREFLRSCVPGGAAAAIIIRSSSGPLTSLSNRSASTATTAKASPAAASIFMATGGITANRI